MRVDGPEIEFESQQENHRSGDTQPFVFAGLLLEGPEPSVQGLQEAVGMKSLNPGCKSTDMTMGHACHDRHCLDLRTQHVGASSSQHPAHDVKLLALKELPKLLTIQPGTSGLQDGHLREPAIEFGFGLCFEGIGIAQ